MGVPSGRPAASGRTPTSRRGAAAWSRAVCRRGAPLLVALAAVACDQSLTVVPVSYLAIVSLVEGPAVAPGSQPVRYHVTEVSGTLGIDTVITVTAADTVVLDLPPATYRVVLDGLPASCAVRYGPEQYAVVYQAPSTTVARYFATCVPALAIMALVDGQQLDHSFVYSVTPAGAVEHVAVGPLESGDSAYVGSLAPGAYDVRLALVAPNCEIVSDGGPSQRVEISDQGNGAVTFRVICSSPSERPSLISFAGSATDRAVGFVFRATDPNHDIERYAWDVTDCRRHSVLPRVPAERRGLSSGRTRGQDTVTVVAAFETGVSSDSLAGRCLLLRVGDEYGNTTPVVERALRPGGGSPPVATQFNAFYTGANSFATDLTVNDVDNDFVGVFATARLRDGTLSQIDGTPDIGLYNVAGYLGTGLPQLPLSSRITYSDVQAVVVYLIDAAGHVVRLEDTDVAR